MNSVVLIGRLTRDPEVRIASGQLVVATFSIAIDRPVRSGGQKQTDFPRITVFGRQAENCERFLTKGRLVGVQGRLQTGSYQNRDGVTVYTTDVVAERVEFLEWSDRRQKEPAPPAPPREECHQTSITDLPPDIPDEFQPVDEDVPF